MSLYGNRSLLCSSFTEKLCIDEKESENEEKNNISKWAHIPDEILELIMKRLCLTDYLALRRICSPWRSTVNKAIAHQHCCPLPELPRIVLLSEEPLFVSLRTEPEQYCPKVSIFESTKSICHGFVEGWIIMCDYVKKDSLSIFFFNPVTNRSVPVSSPLDYPSNSPIQGKNLFLRKMVASSGPDCYKSNNFLAALFNDFCHIAYFSLFDKSWNMIKPEQDSGVHFMDIEIMGCKLYVRTNHPLYSIIVYDLKDSGNGSSPKTKVLARVPQISTPVSRIIDNQHHVTGCAVCSLAKHDTLDQLFLIYTIYDVIFKSDDVGYLNIVKKFVTSPKITAVEVFKMDLKKEPIEWIKCESLDDDVIFVSGVKSMVMSRTSLDCTQALIRENSVYFAILFNCPSDPWQGNLLGIKHLTNSSIKYFSIEKSNHSEVPYPFWFIPSI